MKTTPTQNQNQLDEPTADGSVSAIRLSGENDAGAEPSTTTMVVNVSLTEKCVPCKPAVTVALTVLRWNVL